MVGNIKWEESTQGGVCPQLDNGQSLRLFGQRRDKVLLSLSYVCVLGVSRMSLMKASGSGRIMVPEKSGETLGVIRVPLSPRDKV